MSTPFKIPTFKQLRVLNSWPAGTRGEQEDDRLIAALLALCTEHGFGRVPQLAKQIEDIWRQPAYLAQYADQTAQHKVLLAKSPLRRR